MQLAGCLYAAGSLMTLIAPSGIALAKQKGDMDLRGSAMNHLLLPVTIEKDRAPLKDPSSASWTDAGNGGKRWMVAGLAVVAALIAYAMVRIAN